MCVFDKYAGDRARDVSCYMRGGGLLWGVVNGDGNGDGVIRGGSRGGF